MSLIEAAQKTAEQVRLHGGEGQCRWVVGSEFAAKILKEMSALQRDPSSEPLTLTSLCGYPVEIGGPATEGRFMRVSIEDAS